MSAWVLCLTLPAGPSIDAAQAVLEGLADAVTAFEDPDGAPGPRRPWVVRAYLEAEPDLRAVSDGLATALAGTGVAVPALTAERLPDVDWLAENRASFQPLRIGRWVIRPSHDEARWPPHLRLLTVDAAQAFGTGAHATTQGCLLAIEGLLKQRRPRRSLDLGCGTGVLAMALATAAPGPVLAVDLDPAAARAARDNVRRNGLAQRVTVRQGPGYRPRAVNARAPFDLIVANILARPLIALAPATRRCLAPGGRLVLSGLLTDQERAVIAAHRAQGLVLERRWRRDAWSTLLMRRRGLVGAPAAP